ncbi:MAG: enoyl-CoA hydratase [Thermodesulfobacteriota bacterium]|nr:enoyl-CoA hydratase [Thermodesulfobacteriota bacterium]
MTSEEILLERDKGVATITLNRPERFNAFTTDMYQILPEVIQKLQADDDVRAIIFTGAGKAFCAGSDVSARLAARLKEGGDQNRFETIKQVGSLALDLEKCDKPIIAAINGVAVGAGLSITLASDIRLASDRARFGAVWVKVGLIPDLAATYYLPRILGREKAFELCATGDIIDAEEALRIGLVSRVVPHSELIDEAKNLATRLAAGPAVAIELIKRGLSRALDNDLKRQLDYESYAQNICRGTNDHKEGVQAFSEKRPPKFTGS